MEGWGCQQQHQSIANMVRNGPPSTGASHDSSTHRRVSHQSCWLPEESSLRTGRPASLAPRLKEFNRVPGAEENGDQLGDELLRRCSFCFSAACITTSGISAMGS